MITVNCISLGNIVTPTTARRRRRHPRGGARAREGLPAALRHPAPGTPDDVAGLVTFLASPLAEWITGQTYAVNGGSCSRS